MLAAHRLFNFCTTCFGVWTTLHVLTSECYYYMHIFMLLCVVLCRHGLETIPIRNWFLNGYRTKLYRLIQYSPWHTVKVSQVRYSSSCNPCNRFCSAVYSFLAIFLPCDATRCTVLVIVILSVCPSVCLSHSCTVSTWFDLRS